MLIVHDNSGDIFKCFQETDCWLAVIWLENQLKLKKQTQKENTGCSRKYLLCLRQTANTYIQHSQPRPLWTKQTTAGN